MQKTRATSACVCVATKRDERRDRKDLSLFRELTVWEFTRVQICRGQCVRGTLTGERSARCLHEIAFLRERAVYCMR